MDQPISVTVNVGAQARSFVIVADPADALVAVQLGRTVAELVLEMGSDVG